MESYIYFIRSFYTRASQIHFLRGLPGKKENQTNTRNVKQKKKVE